jgi:hypothetical protein
MPYLNVTFSLTKFWCHRVTQECMCFTILYSYVFWIRNAWWNFVSSSRREVFFFFKLRGKFSSAYILLGSIKIMFAIRNFLCLNKELLSTCFLLLLHVWSYCSYVYSHPFTLYITFGYYRNISTFPSSSPLLLTLFVTLWKFIIHVSFCFLN